MLTFILLCLLVGSVVGFLAGLFGHWWWVNYRPNLGLFIADGRRT